MHAISKKCTIGFCLLFAISSWSFSQEEDFRGIVSTKSYKVDNHISKSAAAKMLTANRDLPLSETLRRSSLKEFAGKFVYLDLWANWCAPCKLEMPFLARIQKKYAKEDLVILSISLDKQEDLSKWKDTVRKLKMTWINWILFDGFQSDFAKEYKIGAIPRYLLLDQRGNLMNGNAPRPSDQRLENLLNELFKKE